MRDLTIDISKCLGIFLVVLGHCLHNDSAAHDVIYLFHMPLFFFLSGFFFREQDLLLFFRNKTKRLLYPFVFYYVFAKIWVIIHCIIVQRQLPTFDLDFFILLISSPPSSLPTYPNGEPIRLLRTPSVE